MTTTAVPPTSTQLCGVFADIDAAVAAAHKAFLAFSDCSLAQRRIFINAVREVASQQERLEYMATAAVEETGMGNAHHKVLKISMRQPAPLVSKISSWRHVKATTA